jgi:hypothetical protein
MYDVLLVAALILQVLRAIGTLILQLLLLVATLIKMKYYDCERHSAQKKKGQIRLNRENKHSTKDFLHCESSAALNRKYRPCVARARSTKYQRLRSDGPMTPLMGAAFSCMVSTKASLFISLPINCFVMTRPLKTLMRRWIIS